MISQQSTNKRTEDSAARLIVNRFNLHNYGDLRSCSASQAAAAMGDEDGSGVISPRFPNQITPIKAKAEPVQFRSAKDEV